MSEKEKPKPHPMVSIAEANASVYMPEGYSKPIGKQEMVVLELGKERWVFTPDNAVSLGMALFEHGLFLKGRVKP